MGNHHDEFVVATTGLGLVMYLTGYNIENPPESTFGNLGNAIIFETLHDAESAATAIGGGTVGTSKPS